MFAFQFPNASLPDGTDLRGADRGVLTQLVNDICRPLAVTVADVAVRVEYVSRDWVMVTLRLPDGTRMAGLTATRPGSDPLVNARYGYPLAKDRPATFLTLAYSGGGPNEALRGHVVAPFAAGGRVLIPVRSNPPVSVPLDDGGYAAVEIPGSVAEVYGGTETVEVVARDERRYGPYRVSPGGHLAPLDLSIYAGRKVPRR